MPTDPLNQTHEDQDLDALLEGEPVVEVNSPVSIGEIQALIQALGQTEDGEPLVHAMDELQKALVENPAACALLLPAEIGECTAAVMKISGKSLEKAVEATAKKGKGKTQQKFDLTDPKVQQELADDLN